MDKNASSEILVKKLRVRIPTLIMVCSEINYLARLFNDLCTTSNRAFFPYRVYITNKMHGEAYK